VYKPQKLVSGLLIVLLLITLFSTVVGAQQRTLQQGMEGEDVRELQETLVMLGERVIIDGIFGPSTKRAVIRFQKESGLPIDGVVGTETWDDLQEAKSFDKHIVRRGDTLSKISSLYGVSVEAIQEANGLDSDLIRPGQELVISKTGLGGNLDTDFYKMISYQVKPGDTLQKLAERYHTTIRRIKEVNELTTNRIRIGQRIEVPKLVLDLSNSSRYTGGKISQNFRWPVSGRISSNFGWRRHPITNDKHFHGGIDIAVNTGTIVRTAESGQVLGSGWIRGFGRTVTIDHGNGVVTLYAHNSSLLVNNGERVTRGEAIAKSGNSGRSTGPHLDFRILINDKPVNPLKYLR